MGPPGRPSPQWGSAPGTNPTVPSLPAFQPNETWVSSHVDNCTEYRCEAKSGVLVLTPQPKTCPDVSSCTVRVREALPLEALPALKPHPWGIPTPKDPTPAIPGGLCLESTPLQEYSLSLSLQGTLRKAGCCYSCEERGESRSPSHHPQLCPTVLPEASRLLT